MFHERDITFVILQVERNESHMEMGRSNTGVSGDSLTDGDDSMMNNSDNNSLYFEGEKVLVLHKDDQWYQAKVYIITKITYL